MPRAKSAGSGKLIGVIQRFWKARKGSISIVFALGMPAILGVAAMATDMGLIYLQRRTMQSASDAAALAAAYNPDSAEASVRMLLDAHGLKDATFVLTFGTYDDSSSIHRDERFTPGPRDNAVRVEAQLKAPAYFARFLTLESTMVSVRSDAAMAPVVSLASGSRLASVGPSALNDLLGSALGVNLNLKVGDYNSLLSSKLQLGPLLNAIVAEGLVKNVTDVLARDVLSQPIKLSALLSLMSKQVDTSGDLVAGAVLRKMAQQTLGADVMVVLGDVLRLGDGVGALGLDYPGPALQTQLSVLGLVDAAIRQNGIGTALKTGIDVPNVLSTGVELMIGESGQKARSLSLSEELPSIDTDQVRARLEVKTGGGLGLLGVGVKIPIEIAVAGGTAKVVSVTCNADPAKREVKVEARPGIVRLSIGKFVGPLKNISVNDKLAAVEMVRLPLVSILGEANLAPHEEAPDTLIFRGKEIGNGTTKTAKVDDIVQSLVQTLLTQTKLTPQVLGIVLNLDGVLATLFNLLSGLTRPIDDIVDSVLATAGVALGEMDVRVDDLVCGNPKIVG